MKMKTRISNGAIAAGVDITRANLASVSVKDGDGAEWLFYVDDLDITSEAGVSKDDNKITLNELLGQNVKTIKFK